MKEYKINIKYYKEANIYADAKNKKEALRMVKEVMTRSNLIFEIKAEDEQFVYKVEEQKNEEE